MAPPTGDQKTDAHKLHEQQCYSDVLERLALLHKHANFSDEFVATDPHARAARDVAKLARRLLDVSQTENYYHHNTVLRGIAKMNTGMARDAAMAEARYESKAEAAKARAAAQAENQKEVARIAAAKHVTYSTYEADDVAGSSVDAGSSNHPKSSAEIQAIIDNSMGKDEVSSEEDAVVGEVKEAESIFAVRSLTIEDVKKDEEAKEVQKGNKAQRNQAEQSPKTKKKKAKGKGKAA